MPQTTAGDRRPRRDPAASRAAGAEGDPAEEKPVDRWVCFDVGETLIDETRVWTTWAELLDVTPLTFMATLGTVIARGDDHQEVFRVLGRKDWKKYRDAFDERYGSFRDTDLYYDAAWGLQALADQGYRIAILANQPGRRTSELRALGLRADIIAMSDELGVHKPAPEFFVKALGLMDAAAGDVAYVGDRLDNDVRPSLAAGIKAVWLERGPWARLAPGADATYIPDVFRASHMEELVERVVPIIWS